MNENIQVLMSTYNGENIYEIRLIVFYRKRMSM